MPPSSHLFYDLLERIAAEVDVTDLPVRTGSLNTPLDEYGALGLAFKAATTLGEWGRGSSRYARLWTSVVEYELREDPRGTLFILHRPGEQRLGAAFVKRGDAGETPSRYARQVSPLLVRPGWLC